MSETNPTNYLPVLIIIVIWIISMSALLLSKLFDNPVSDSYEVYDKCESYEVKYRYFVKIVFNPRKRKHFDFNTNMLTIRIHDKKGVYEGTFNIKTILLAGVKHLNQKTEQNFQLIVNRMEKIPEWGHVVIYTEDQGSIFIYSMKVISIDTKEQYFIPINTMVKSSEPTKQYNEEQFKCESQKWDEDNEEGRPEKKMEPLELFLVLFLSFNLVLLVMSLMYHIGGQNSFLRRKRFVSPLLSAVLVFFIQTSVLMFYRFFIKEGFYRSYGSKWWHRICHLFLGVCSLIGITAGIVGTFLLLRSEHSYDWNLTFSVLWLFLFTVLFVIICYLIKSQIFIDLRVKTIKDMLFSPQSSTSKTSMSAKLKEES